jgi:predicted nucleic acid-binding protein
MKVFLDTNILLDYLEERKPFDEDAIKILTLGYLTKLELFCSAVSFTTLFYYLRKIHGGQKALMALKDIRKIVFPTEVNALIISRALDSSITDFEDAIQLESAITIINLHCIITRNIRDFKTKEILVQTPKEFLQTL